MGKKVYRDILKDVLENKDIASFKDLNDFYGKCTSSYLCKRYGIYDEVKSIFKERKKVFGIGINDAKYVQQIKETVGYKSNGEKIQRKVWECPYYTKWYSVLRRVEGNAKDKNYKDCTISDEWKTFSNFKRWCTNYEEMYNIQIDGSYNIDKDLVYIGNKHYSADTCFFLPTDVNEFMTEYKNDNIFTGCTEKSQGNFAASCKNIFGERYKCGATKIDFLGYSKTKQEAHFAWAVRKREIVEEIIDRGILSYDKHLEQLLRNRYDEKLSNARRYLEEI